MKIINTFIIVLILLSSLVFAQEKRKQTQSGKVSDSITQRWLGGAKIGEDWVSVRLESNITAGRVTGTVSVRQLEIVRQPIQIGTLKGRAIRLVVPAADSAPLIITGTITDDRIKGTLQKGDSRGDFQIRLIGSANEQALARFAGEYRLSSDRLIYITPQSEALHYVDVQTGSRGWLFPDAQSDLTFIEILPYNSATLAPQPRITVTFERGQNGKITGLRWREADRPPVLAPQDLIRREDINYPSNGNVSIAGTLYFPKGAAPYPAIILRGGAGSANRTNFDYMARFFVEQGFAVLTSDKRGVGTSTGNFEGATYQDFADDIFAGLRFLQSRKDIRRKEIGMWGHSEGAWVAPMAAAKAPEEISFIILSAAIGVPPWQQELFLTEHLLRAEGYSEAEVADAFALRGLMFQVLAAKGKGWEEFRAEVVRHRSARWLERLIDTTEDKQKFLTLNQDLLHDPEPSLRALRGPILAIVGECDHFVPAQESRVALAQIFSANKNLDYTILTIPGMGHGLQDECGDTDRKAFQVRGYSTEYLNTLRQWMRQHGLSNTTSR